MTFKESQSVLSTEARTQIQDEEQRNSLLPQWEMLNEHVPCLSVTLLLDFVSSPLQLFLICMLIVGSLTQDCISLYTLDIWLSVRIIYRSWVSAHPAHAPNPSAALWRLHLADTDASLTLSFKPFPLILKPCCVCRENFRAAFWGVCSCALRHISTTQLFSLPIKQVLTHLAALVLPPPVSSLQKLYHSVSRMSRLVQSHEEAAGKSFSSEWLPVTVPVRTVEWWNVVCHLIGKVTLLVCGFEKLLQLLSRANYFPIPEDWGTKIMGLWDYGNVCDIIIWTKKWNKSDERH